MAVLTTLHAHVVHKSLYQALVGELRKHADSVNGIILTKHNMKNVSCEKFYAYVIGNEELLRRVGSSDK